MQDDLNITSDPENANSPPAEDGKGKASGRLSLLYFDPRAMLFYLLSKWKSLAIFFACSLFFSAILFHYISKYSQDAWSSTVQIYHQTRSEKIPAFYIPMKTETIAYIFTSNSVGKKASDALKESARGFGEEMLSGVSVSVDKAKPDIINITASAPDPKMAAQIVNTVADIGISEYLAQQNSSVNAMISDMKFKKAERMSEKNALRQRQSRMFSSRYNLYPPQELKFLNEELVKAETMIYSCKIRISELSSKISELAKLLEETPKEIEFETTMDHTAQISLEGKLSTLKNLRKRYTDENPKVRMLMDEIKELQENEGKKQQTPTKITYRKNLNYADLELQLLNARLEKKTLEETLKNHTKESERIKGEIASLAAKVQEYDDLKTKEAVYDQQIESINLSLQNLEVLLSSSIPNLNILNRSGIPTSSSIKNVYMKSLMLCLFLLFLYTAIVVAKKALKMRFLSSKEFAALNIRDLGEIPPRENMPNDKIEFSIVKAHSRFHKDSNGRKVILLVKYSRGGYSDEIINEFRQLDTIKGAKSYTVECRYSGAKKDKSAQRECISQKSPQNPDCGVFEYYDELHIRDARLREFKSKIKTLGKDYDNILISVLSDNNAFVISQLIKTAKHVIFMPVFDSTKKSEILSQMEAAQELARDKKDFCALLVNVPKLYTR